MPSDIFVEALAGKCDPLVVNNPGLTLRIQFTPSDVFWFFYFLFLKQHHSCIAMANRKLVVTLQTTGCICFPWPCEFHLPCFDEAPLAARPPSNGAGDRTVCLRSSILHVHGRSRHFFCCCCCFCFSFQSHFDYLFAQKHKEILSVQ